MRSQSRSSRLSRLSRCSPETPRGFTLVEVMVSIGIIGLLVAMLLPAVQSVRQTAARTQCLNNFRQIGIATQNYEATFRVLPGSENRPLFNLLPFVEQQNVFSSPHVYGLHLSVFLCPSDGSHDFQLSPYNYLMNTGSKIGFPNGVCEFFGREFRFSEISDGLSMTALFSERRSGFSDPQTTSNLDAQCRREPWRCVWYLGSVYDPGDEAEFANDCRNPSQWLGVTPFVLDNRDIYEAQIPYSHIVLPNSPSCSARTGVYSAHGTSATSFHGGGVNLLLCDGSARFVSNEINAETWRALGSRDGNETIGDF